MLDSIQAVSNTAAEISRISAPNQTRPSGLANKLQATPVQASTTPASQNTQNIGGFFENAVFAAAQSNAETQPEFVFRTLFGQSAPPRNLLNTLSAG